MKEETVLHWQCIGYEKKWVNPKLKGDEKFLGGVHVEVVAKNEKEAIEKAKKILKRPNYRVMKVYECETPWQHNRDDGLHDEMQMTQLKIQKRMLDVVEGHKNI